MIKFKVLYLFSTSVHIGLKSKGRFVVHKPHQWSPILNSGFSDYLMVLGTHRAAVPFHQPHPAACSKNIPDIFTYWHWIF